MAKKGQFKIQKVSDAGTGNPIVSRLTMGLYDIIQFTILSDEQKETIKAVNFEAMRHLTKAEKIGNKIREQIERNIEQIKKNGVQTQSFERCVEVPHTENLDDISDFLKSSKKVLQEMMKIFNLFIATGHSSPRYDKVILKMKEKYGDKDEIVRVIQENYDIWIKKLLDLRDEDEHPREKQFFRDIDINYDENQGMWIVDEPKFYDGTPIYNYVKSTIYNLFIFCEAISVNFSRKNFPEGVDVYEVPQEERNPDGEVRFRVGWKEGYPKLGIKNR